LSTRQSGIAAAFAFGLCCLSRYACTLSDFNAPISVMREEAFRAAIVDMIRNR